MNIDSLREQLATAVEPIDRDPTAYRRIQDGIARRRRLRVIAAGCSVAGVAAAVTAIVVLTGVTFGGDGHHRIPGTTATTTTGTAPAFNDTDWIGQHNKTLGVYDSRGRFLRDLVPAPSANSMNTLPAAAPDGSLYFVRVLGDPARGATSCPSQVWRYSPDGRVSRVLSTKQTITSLSANADTLLYAAGTNCYGQSPKLFVRDLQSGSTHSAGSVPHGYVGSAAIGPDGSVAWVDDNGAHLSSGSGTSDDLVPVDASSKAHCSYSAVAWSGTKLAVVDACGVADNAAHLDVYTDHGDKWTVTRRVALPWLGGVPEVSIGANGHGVLTQGGTGAVYTFDVSSNGATQIAHLACSPNTACEAISMAPGTPSGSLTTTPEAPATPSALTVPDVRGLPLAQAEQRLAVVGLTVRTLEQTEQNATPGTVIGETPVPGTVAKPGSSVLLVYIAPAPGSVDVDGDGTPDQARVQNSGNTRRLIVKLGSGSTLSAPSFAAGNGLPASTVTGVDVNGDGHDELLVSEPGADSTFYLLYTLDNGKLVQVRNPGTQDGTLIDGGGINDVYGFGCASGRLSITSAVRTGSSYAVTSTPYRLDGSKLVKAGTPAHKTFNDPTSAAFQSFMGNGCGVHK